jgi:hypothetical protein
VGTTVVAERRGGRFSLERFHARNARHFGPPRALGGKELNEEIVDYEQVVAVGLLTQNDVRLLGPSFERLWPVDETTCFAGLLRAIDEADRESAREEAPAEAQIG